MSFRSAPLLRRELSLTLSEGGEDFAMAEIDVSEEEVEAELAALEKQWQEEDDLEEAINAVVAGSATPDQAALVQRLARRRDELARTNRGKRHMQTRRRITAIRLAKEKKTRASVAALWGMDTPAWQDAALIRQGATVRLKGAASAAAEAATLLAQAATATDDAAAIGGDAPAQAPAPLPARALAQLEARFGADAVRRWQDGDAGAAAWIKVPAADDGGDGGAAPTYFNSETGETSATLPGIGFAEWLVCGEPYTLRQAPAAGDEFPAVGTLASPGKDSADLMAEYKRLYPKGHGAGGRKAPPPPQPVVDLYLPARRGGGGASVLLDHVPVARVEREKYTPAAAGRLSSIRRSVALDGKGRPRDAAAAVIRAVFSGHGDRPCCGQERLDTGGGGGGGAEQRGEFEWKSFRDVYEDMKRVPGALLAHGVRPGAFVGFCAENSRSLLARQDSA